LREFFQTRFYGEQPARGRERTYSDCHPQIAANQRVTAHRIAEFPRPARPSPLPDRLMLDQLRGHPSKTGWVAE